MRDRADGRRLLFVISYHHACNDGALIALVALLPILVDEMGLTYTEIGILGLGLMITVVVQLVVGRVADRLFSRYLLELGAMLMALSFFLVLFVNDFVELFVAVILMRMGASFYHPVGISWITREYAGPYLDTALGIQSGIGNFGVIASLATSGFLGDSFGWKMPCVMWMLLNLAAVVMGVLTVRNEEVPPRRVKLAKASMMSTVSKISVFAVPIAAGGALYTVTTYYGPVNLTTMHGWSTGMADLAFAMWLAVGTVSSYYFGAISARFGRRTIVRAGYTVSALALLALYITSTWYLMVPLLLVYGMMLFLTYPALFAMVSDATAEEERGTAFGVVFAAQLGGGSALVYFCGAVADRFDDPSIAFIITAAFALVSVLAMLGAGNRGAMQGRQETVNDPGVPSSR